MSNAVSSEEIHRDISQVISPILEPFGFAIFGGRAIIIHELSSRPTEDIDMFTNMLDVEMATVSTLAAKALSDSGFVVEIDTAKLSADFARITVVAQTGDEIKIDLARDNRERAVSRTEWGLVAHRLDIVSSKMSALWSRNEVRDAIDVASMVISGSFSKRELVELLTEFDAGFALETFAPALHRASIHSDSEFAEYGKDSIFAESVRALFVGWREEILAAQ